jgi:UDP-glucose 6-dehydrogenase
MENAFYAVKVTFVNEFYDIAKAHGVDFNELREVWLADTRISRDHTFVYPDARGFSGKCLPKDCNAIVKSCLERGYEPKLMQATLEINKEFQRLNERR